MRKQSAERQRGEKISYHVAFLQESGKKAASFGRKSFESQRRTDAPLASHGDAEECSHDEKHLEGWGEGAGEFEDRIGDDVEHQRGAAAETVGEETEQEGTNGAHGQGDEVRFEDGGDFQLEMCGNGAGAKNQDEVIEGVEGPAEETGNEGVALHWSEASEISDDAHGRPPWRNFGDTSISATRATWAISRTS